MKTHASRSGLFVFEFSCFLLILLFITNAHAQMPRKLLEQGNRLQPFSEELLLVATNLENANTFDSKSKLTSVNAFKNLKPTDLEAQAFLLVNQQRALKNLKPLELDLGMLFVAREHSDEMAKFNHFSHAGRDGTMADERLAKVGITDWQGIGENIAFSQNADNEVELAIKSWLGSRGHRENLLNPSWTSSGIGIAVTSDHKFYITQVFRK
jgi:uncharacterized protein YkwD